MKTLEASKARYFFEPTAIGPDVLKVVDFVGQETISRCYRFDINLISDDPDVNFEDVINKPATFTMTRGDDRVPIRGVVIDFQQGGRTADWIAYRASLVPRLWLLSLTYQSRVFQNMTVDEIITQVLKDAGFNSSDYRFALKQTYKQREYTVQYRETDLNFISRLMEYEGICYFFDHQDNGEVLVITDDRSEFAFIDVESTLSYHEGAGLVGEEGVETISHFVAREQVVTGKVVLKDYNCRTPQTTLMADSQVNKDMPGTYYEYGEHFKDVPGAKALSKIRNQEFECAHRVNTGDSDCVGLRSGYKITLQKHYRNSLNGDYLLTSVTHFGSQGAGFALTMGGAESPTYRNAFTCIPADMDYRPPRVTPEPRLPGILTARVESAGGNYAHLDDEGRYRVKMPFDLSGKSQGQASRAIRLAQPYTGSNYGMHFPVLEGAEMVFACVDGNIDRPLGLSTVPNPSEASPVTANNKWQNILRTAAGNELVMDDKINETQISLKTTDAHTILMDDKDDKIEVTSTKKHVVLMDDKNQNITIQTTNGHLVLIDDKNTKITIQSKNGHTVAIDDTSGSEKITVADAKNENTLTIDIANNQLSLFSKNGGIDLQAPNGLVEIKAKTLNVETTADTSFKAVNYNLKAQSNIDMQAQSAIDVKATADLKMKGMNVEAKADMNFKCEGGMNLELKAGMNAKLDGMMTDVNGATMTKVKGAIVMIN